MAADEADEFTATVSLEDHGIGLIDETSEIAGGFERSLLQKLDAADSSLQRVRRFVDKEREKQANNQLNTASQQIGALLNAFDAQSSNGNRDLPPALERRIEQQAAAIIENVVTAKDAAI